MDPEGNIIVADTGNDAIRVVITEDAWFGNEGKTVRNVYTIAGGPNMRGNSPGDFFNAKFNTPTDVQFDREGCNLVVKDNGNRIVRSIATTMRCSGNVECTHDFKFYSILLIMLGTSLGTIILPETYKIITRYYLQKREQVLGDAGIPDELGYVEIPEPDECGLPHQRRSASLSEWHPPSQLEDSYRPLLLGDSYVPPSPTTITPTESVRSESREWTITNPTSQWETSSGN
eukprot:4671973-Pyramimonas_sp.AAC.1